MKSNSEKSDSRLNRRMFINLAGIAATMGFTTARAESRKDDSGNSAPTAEPARTVDNKIADILETKVICRQPGRFAGQDTEYGVNHNGHLIIKKEVLEEDRYLGWATIAKTNSGELLVVFSGDRDSHVCPWGKTQMIRSADWGKTWSEPETITSTPLDDRDAGIIQTHKGTLVVSWFTSLAFERPNYAGASKRYARHAEKISQETRKQWLGNWTRRSEDGGKSWQDPVRTVGTAPHGPIQLKDGRLLYIGNGQWEGKGPFVIEESRDDGRSWKVISTIAKPSDTDDRTGLSEPHMVQLKSGKIIAMFRHEPRDRQCFLLQSESRDGGKTWSPLRNTGIWGYPPHLIELKNGWVLVAYGHRKEPFGEKACISRDEGKTWDIENEIFLTGAPTQDLGYPSSIQLDDGSILTVYYQSEGHGKPTMLMSTHWKLK